MSKLLVLVVVALAGCGVGVETVGSADGAVTSDAGADAASDAPVDAPCVVGACEVNGEVYQGCDGVAAPDGKIVYWMGPSCDVGAPCAASFDNGAAKTTGVCSAP